MMTPRERAQQFINIVPLYHLDTEGKIDAIAEMITSDRQALQSEIVSRLQLECNSSRHDASGGYYFNVAMNAAIEIVQSIFTQSESKPVFDPSLPVCQPETCPISEAESDRRVLAEREACASVAEVMTVGEIQEFARLRGRNIAAAIRARSNPAPEIIACSNEAPKPGQVAMVKDGKVVFVDPPADWRHLGDGVFQIPESDASPSESNASELLNEDQMSAIKKIAVNMEPRTWPSLTDSPRVENKAPESLNTGFYDRNDAMRRYR